jgi:hypothetical protein
MTRHSPHTFIRWQTLLTLLAVKAKANNAAMRFWQWTMT